MGKIYYRFQLLLLFYEFLLKRIQAADVYVSSVAQTSGDGSIAFPYSSLQTALSTTDSIVIIHILSNKVAYVIDSAITISNNLRISYNQGGSNPIIIFQGLGSLVMSGAYTLNVENMNFTQIADENGSQDVTISITKSSEITVKNSLFTQITSNITILNIGRAESCIFSNTTFINNSIFRQFIQVSNVKNLTLDSCSFSETYIESGHYFYTSSSQLTITNCNFWNNTINQTNVAVTYSLVRAGSSANISSSVFKNNFLSNATLLTLENDDISTAIYIKICDHVLFLSNSQILDMTLGINILGQNIQVVLENNVTFSKNYAKNSFLYISNTLNAADIKELYLLNNYGYEMVALQLIKNITIIQMKCINSNDMSASYYLVNEPQYTPGNCLSIVNYASFQLLDTEFSNNYAISTLSGLFLEHTSDINLLGKNANELEAFLVGFKCLENTVNATLSNLINSGNCILLSNSGTTTISDSQIFNNVVNVDLEAEYSGNPCLTSSSNDNNLTIADSQFKGNKAYSECSCLNFHGSNFLLKNVTFIENRSIKLGIGTDAPTFYVDNEGGCMNLGAEAIIMLDILIYNSTAMKGAGIFFHNKNSKNYQTLDARNLTIIRNEGIQTSGIEFDASLIVGDYYFRDSLINYNKVEFYGVISTFYYTAFNVYYFDCDISYNWGISAGAALSFYHFGGNFYINNSRIAGNVLNESVFVGGAALFLYGTTYYTLIYVTDCAFINNTSTLKGGAIQTMYGQVHALRCDFIDNIALYGGAVSIAIYCPGSYRNIVVRSQYQVNQGGAFHFSEQSQVE